MPCLVALVCLMCPRVVLFLGWIFGFTAAGLQGQLWPVLGFLFMPFTTLAYAFSHIYGTGIEGGWLAVLIVAVLMDLGSTAAAGT